MVFGFGFGFGIYIYRRLLDCFNHLAGLSLFSKFLFTLFSLRAADGSALAKLTVTTERASACNMWHVRLASEFSTVAANADVDCDVD